MAEDSFTTGLPSNTPMSPTLLAKLFGVPLLIVGIIVGCAVVVVLLFGDIVSEPERPIGELLTVLERPTGEKIIGMSLPQDKETWQAARELAMRLTKPEQELAGEDRTLLVSRLTRLIEQDASDLAHVPEGKGRDMAQQKLGFVMGALARIGDPSSLTVLRDQLTNPSPLTRRDALAALSGYPFHSDLDAYVTAIGSRLSDDSPEVRMVACVVLSGIATAASRPNVIALLKNALDDAEREVQWNAALGLGRLGDAHGKNVLLDLLDREFWEQRVRYQPPGSDARSEAAQRHALSPERIKHYLIYAIQAASQLSDEACRNGIEKLLKDSDPAVRGEAMTAMQRHGVEIAPHGQLETSAPPP